jgi:phage shock protein C
MPPAPPPSGPSAAGTGRPRLLRRSRDDKVIAGVSGGLGRYLGVDPVLLRIAFVVLAIAGGGGILLYLIAWIVIPLETEGEQLGEAPPSSGATLRLLVGGGLIAVGGLLLLDVALPRIGRYLWPIALIVVGIAIVIQASSSRR